ncbi:MAG: HEXXH motif domain-containing protein [Nitrospira sp.]|nr:MAG: HEXXH motif domain-containing protein [Nitrospira sp.]
MSVLELQPLAHLTDEFRLSMRRLLQDLGRELQADYPDLSSRLKLPVGFFQLLGRSLKVETYSNWKVVGWIETLNDLVYFLDILQQWASEQDRREFTEQLFAECQEKFFENSYLADLFPLGRQRTTGLEQRLTSLCHRLAQELTQESLFFNPALTVNWCRQRKLPRWDVPGLLEANFERAEEWGVVSVGIAGEWCEAPNEVRRALTQSSGHVTFQVDGSGISVKIGRVASLLWTGWGTQGEWRWNRQTAVTALETARGPVMVGPTLVYGKDRQPRTVVRTEQKRVGRFSRAWRTIQQAWPEGHAVLALLTSRIVPFKAKGVVSFSYRHRPGLSFINCFDRDNLDLIDDLIHENSHHHLNLLLRKYVMYHGDHNQQIFYSPWRRSLRPLRGILHATFTFTMGAMLFERLSVWASGKSGATRWKRAGLTQRDLQRARYRCLEEVESVRYSLQDLHYADHHLGWLTGSGRRMIGQLAEAIEQVERSITPHRKAVLASTFGPALRRHVKELRKARMTYGPVRLGKV